MPGPDLPKAYRPSDHEGRIRARWDEARAFHADPRKVTDGGKTPYSIVIPPPNVTAALHLGHALNNTLQDVQARAHRMMGDETLWMPGTDHAGIATQTVVEKRLLKDEGKRRTEYERDVFVGKVQAFKDEYEQVITGQLKAMGCSCDWDRQRFTMDEVCAKAVREAFFRLFSDGLIYRGKRLVNWDPVTQTVLADDEVEMEEVDGAFYYLRYPLCDGGGAPITLKLWNHATGKTEELSHVTVATTRPETYLGDTAVAVNPRDPRWAALSAARAHVKLPFVGRVIPVLADDYVVLPAALHADPEAAKTDAKAAMATGYLKVTPAHDPNDAEIGKRHNLPAINVMAPDASISDKHGWTDVGEARRFVGMSREDARQAVVAAFREANLLEAVKPHRHSVGHSYRSHAAIEPYLSDQWYIAVKKPIPSLPDKGLIPGTDVPVHSLAGLALAPVLDGSVRFVPERYTKTYQTWLENLRDWPISRQLWWGHRIPVWSAADSAKTPDGAAMQTIGDTEFVCAKDAEQDRPDLHRQLHERGFRQDPDVLDTWFSSGLWPLSTMGWPEPDQSAETRGLLAAFNPTDVLCTAREIITLWVSRMVMFNRYFLASGGEPGPVPFRDVFIHAMIQDGEGRKMSKSLGNGVDPLDIIATHGADAMRYTLCHMTTQTQDVRMPVERDEATGKNTSPKFDLGRNFCNKLWNAARFAIAILEDDSPTAAGELSLPDRWMLSRLEATVRESTEAIRGYEYSAYAQGVYDLLWRDFCDWYLEAIKPTVRQNAAQKAVLRATLDAILRLLHPICPFITEAIHERLRTIPAAPVHGLTLGEANLLCLAPWPTAEGSLHNADAEARFERLRSLIGAIREARAQQSIPPKRRITLHLHAGAKDLAGQIQDAAGLVETMAGLERATLDPAPSGEPTSPLTFEAMEHRLGGLFDAASGGDLDAEKARLNKKVEDLSKEIAALEGRLNNPGYAQRAPAALVQQTRDQLATKVAERDATSAALKGLG